MGNGNEAPDSELKGSNLYDVMISAIRAVRDVLNDRLVAVILAIAFLLFSGAIAADELGPMIEGWIYAVKGVQ